MAKITVDVDTELKTMQVVVNGVVQQNIQEANFCYYSSYSYNPNKRDLSVRITSYETSNDGITTMTHLTTGGSDKTIVDAKPSKTYDGLNESVSNNKAVRDIQSYFANL